MAEEATADEGAQDEGAGAEDAGDDAPDVEGMDDGDRGNDTGRTPAQTANDTGRGE